MTKKLAIILARGRSKRIPHKNIKLFLGQPIIKYSIDAAIKSKCFDEVMVSTDDKKIARISKKLGAKVPFFRSKKNSDDYSTTSDVIKETLREYKKRSKEFEYFCCIYPTAVFITPQKIKKALKVMIKNKVDSVFPIAKYSPPIQRSIIVENKKLKRAYPKYEKYRSQDLKPFYYDCGQFYWGRTETFLKNNKLLTKNTIGIETPELEVQDIDNLEDWHLAELKYKYQWGRDVEGLNLILDKVIKLKSSNNIDRISHVGWNNISRSTKTKFEIKK